MRPSFRAVPLFIFYDTEGNADCPPHLLVDLTDDLEVTADGALTLSSEMEPLGVLTHLDSWPGGAADRIGQSGLGGPHRRDAAL